MTRTCLMVLALGLLLSGCERATESGQLDVQDLLGGDAAAGYMRALEPRPWSFPADHGPHPGFRNEWWYITGHLHDSDGGRYGLQLTFFRHQLRAGVGGEGWRSPQAWMAHFALSELDAGRYHSAERFGGEGAGVAGANTHRVWLDDWSLSGFDTTPMVMNLHAHHRGISISLALEPQSPVVSQGERGLSQKGSGPGNASYYYSIPRLRAYGAMQRDGTTHELRGELWLDREWSTSALEPGLAGWDWFALQLQDGSNLMLYRLRREDGSSSPFSAGSLQHPDGRVENLNADAFTLQPLEHWSSPDGQRYPVRWRIRLASGVEWIVSTPMNNQWFNHRFRYWEGAVDVHTVGGKRQGQGYLEMTGY